MLLRHSTAQECCVVVVDPYSTGAMVAAELLQRRFQVIALWTKEVGENLGCAKLLLRPRPPAHWGYEGTVRGRMGSEKQHVLEHVTFGFSTNFPRFFYLTHRPTNQLGTNMSPKPKTKSDYAGQGLREFWPKICVSDLPRASHHTNRFSIEPD